MRHRVYSSCYPRPDEVQRQAPAPPSTQPWRHAVRRDRMASAAITADLHWGLLQTSRSRTGGTAISSRGPRGLRPSRHMLLPSCQPGGTGLPEASDSLRWWETQPSGTMNPPTTTVSRQQGGRPHPQPFWKIPGAAAGGGAIHRCLQIRRSGHQARLHSWIRPGYDPVSVTAVAGGASNLICFTTGRGSCLVVPAPSLKPPPTRRYRRTKQDIGYQF